jgi:hypothetical protein
MSGRDFGTRHVLFYLIINGLSATADGFGRESAGRFASRNNRNNFPCNFVSARTPEYALRYHAAGLLPKLPGQNCSQKQQEKQSVQFCFRKDSGVCPVASCGGVAAETDRTELRL